MRQAPLAEVQEEDSLAPLSSLYLQFQTLLGLSISRTFSSLSPHFQTILYHSPNLTPSPINSAVGPVSRFTMFSCRGCMYSVQFEEGHSAVVCVNNIPFCAMQNQYKTETHWIPTTVPLWVMSSGRQQQGFDPRPIPLESSPTRLPSHLNCLKTPERRIL
jgi:hypothetical protein